MRWLIRTVATIAGVCSLVGVAYLLNRYGLKNEARDRFKEGVSASQAIRAELGLDSDLRVEAAPDSDDDVIVTVRYHDIPGDPNTRREVMRNTNMVARRYVHRVRDLKILFDDQPDNLPSWDGGIAVAGAPVPFGMDQRGTAPAPAAAVDAGVAVTAPVKAAKKGGGAQGTVTLVTFPEADVFKGGTKLGRTPLFNVELPVGTHMLTLVGQDGAHHRLSMPVKVGKNKPLKMNLSDLPAK